MTRSTPPDTTDFTSGDAAPYFLSCESAKVYSDPENGYKTTYFFEGLSKGLLELSGVTLSTELSTALASGFSPTSTTFSSGLGLRLCFFELQVRTDFLSNSYVF